MDSPVATQPEGEAPAVPMPDFRRRRLERPLLAYEVLASADAGTPKNLHRAEATMSAGWSYGPHPPIPLQPPVAWTDAGRDNRSLEFNLHAWDGLGSILGAYAATGGDRFIDFAVAVADDWARINTDPSDDESFAWYDMAIGLRAYRLAFILDVSAREERFGDDLVGRLLDSALLHLRALQDDRKFAPHSNHGFFFAAGQLALARRFPELPGAEEAMAQGYKRMHRLLGTQFSEEGVHNEHSPDYHRMVLDTFLGLLREGLIDEPDISERSDRIQEALAWFILPDGTLAAFGDSPRRRLGRKAPAKFTNAVLQYALTRGDRGAPPPRTMRAFPSAGYVVVRDGWPAGDQDPGGQSYLAQTCAFHSRVHKHADDLSFIWFDHGHELLADSGRYGYLGRTEPGSDLWNDGFWYADPARIYVESTKAHNTVEIDGRNLPRVGVEPYGSALVDSGAKAGVHYTLARVTHWGRVEHQRALLFRPGSWLVVLDRVVADGTESHSVVQRFQFAPELRLRRAETGPGLTFDVGASGPALHVRPFFPATLVEPVRGQAEPDLLGWVSRKDEHLQMCWTAGFAGSGADVTLATLFSLEPDAPVIETAPAGVPAETVLSWRIGQAVHLLTVGRLSASHLAVDYTVAAEL
jgi:hypothetical protein